MVSDHTRLPAHEMEALIRSVSESREPPNLGSLEPPKLSLRPELWAEYDPLYPHVHPRLHQEVIERRPAITKASPMGAPPPEAPK